MAPNPNHIKVIAHAVLLALQKVVLPALATYYVFLSLGNLLRIALCILAFILLEVLMNMNWNTNKSRIRNIDTNTNHSSLNNIRSLINYFVNADSLVLKLHENRFKVKKLIQDQTEWKFSKRIWGLGKKKSQNRNANEAYLKSVRPECLRPYVKQLVDGLTDDLTEVLQGGFIHGVSVGMFKDGHQCRFFQWSELGYIDQSEVDEMWRDIGVVEVGDVEAEDFSWGQLLDSIKDVSWVIIERGRTLMGIAVRKLQNVLMLLTEMKIVGSVVVFAALVIGRVMQSANLINQNMNYNDKDSDAYICQAFPQLYQPETNSLMRREVTSATHRRLPTIDNSIEQINTLNNMDISKNHFSYQAIVIVSIVALDIVAKVKWAAAINTNSSTTTQKQNIESPKPKANRSRVNNYSTDINNINVAYYLSHSRMANADSRSSRSNNIKKSSHPSSRICTRAHIYEGGLDLNLLDNDDNDNQNINQVENGQETTTASEPQVAEITTGIEINSAVAGLDLKLNDNDNDKDTINNGSDNKSSDGECDDNVKGDDNDYIYNYAFVDYGSLEEEYENMYVEYYDS